MQQSPANAVRVAVELVDAVLVGLRHVDTGAEFLVHRAAVLGQYVARGLVHVDDGVVRCGVATSARLAALRCRLAPA